MNKFLFAVLALAAGFAHADNYVGHKKVDGKFGGYMTYQANDMKRNVENNWMYVSYRNCKQLSAQQVIQREKLEPNSNIVGGYHCGLPNGSTMILLKDLSKIDKDNHAVVTK